MRLRIPEIASMIITERTSSRTKKPPRKLVLRLENQPNSDEMSDEEDSLYADTPTPVTRHPHSGKLQSTAEGNDNFVNVTTTPSSQKIPEKASDTPSHSKSGHHLRSLWTLSPNSVRRHFSLTVLTDTIP